MQTAQKDVPFFKNVSRNISLCWMYLTFRGSIDIFWKKPKAVHCCHLVASLDRVFYFSIWFCVHVCLCVSMESWWSSGRPPVNWAWTDLQLPLVAAPGFTCQVMLGLAAGVRVVFEAGYFEVFFLVAVHGKNCGSAEHV